MEQLYNFQDVHGNHHPLINKNFFDIVTKYSSEFDNMIDYERDFLIDYFWF